MGCSQESKGTYMVPFMLIQHSAILCTAHNTQHTTQHSTEHSTEHVIGISWEFNKVCGYAGMLEETENLYSQQLVELKISNNITGTAVIQVPSVHGCVVHNSVRDVFRGRIMRGDTTKPRSKQWTLMVSKYDRPDHSI